MSIDNKPEEQQNENMAHERKSLVRRLPFIGFMAGLYDKYDSTFLTMLGMQYFNQGSKTLVILAA